MLIDSSMPEKVGLLQTRSGTKKRVQGKTSFQGERYTALHLYENQLIGSDCPDATPEQAAAAKRDFFESSGADYCQNRGVHWNTVSITVDTEVGKLMVYWNDHGLVTSQTVQDNPELGVVDGKFSLLMSAGAYLGVFADAPKEASGGVLLRLVRFTAKAMSRIEVDAEHSSLKSLIDSKIYLQAEDRLSQLHETGFGASELARHGGSAAAVAFAHSQADILHDAAGTTGLEFVGGA